MKKSVLFSAALVAAGSALAGPTTFQKAAPTAFSAAQKVEAAAPGSRMMTRADGDMQTMDFTYAWYPANAYSLNGVTGGTTRIYLGFLMTASDIQALKGSKVTGFTVYSPLGPDNAPNTIKDARFFYSIGMKGEEYSQNFQMATQAAAENRIALSEPYTITGEEPGIVFGYSFVVPKADDMAYLITDSTPNDANTGLYSASNTSDFPQEFYSFSSQIGSLCMSLTIEGESLPSYISFSSVPSSICLPVGQASTLPVTVSYTSYEPVESFTLEYTLGGSVSEADYAAAEPMPAGAARKFQIGLEFPAQSDKFKETVEFRLTKINGHDNVGPGTTANANVVVVNEVPVRQTLMEEYTSTSCTWCTRGFAALEYLKKNYPDFVTASFHSQFQSADPMQVTSDFPWDVAGFPTAVLNRSAEMDPYYGTEQYMNLTVPIVGDIMALNEVPTPWKIEVSHEWESENVLVAKADVANMAGYENGNYKIAYLLIADGLSGKTSTWFQTNGYASQLPSADYCEELNAFCRGGAYGKSRVGGLVFNDVVVSPEGIQGVEGSLPASLESEEVVSHSLSFDLSKVKSMLIPDKKKLRVVAAIIDARGQVENCAKNEVNDEYEASGVEGITDQNAPVEYYNLSGLRVAEPTQGIFIRRQGDKTEKVVIR